VFIGVRHRRRALPFAVGALGPALALGAYHAALFGRPWTLPYAHLADEGYRVFHHGQGWLGVGRPRLGALKAAALNVDYGLFAFSPFLALGLLVSLWAFVRGSGPGRAAHALILAVTAGMLTFLSAVANWRAGWCAGGPRYVAAVVPFLTFALALGWKDTFAGRRWRQAGLAALVLVAVFLCLLSGAIFPHFPLQFDNPIFDLVIPLLREGHAPYSLGTLLGLRGLVSLLPLGLLALVASAATLAISRPGRATSTAAALAVAVVLLAGLSRHGTRARRDEDRARAYVRDIWEPRLSAEVPEGGPRGPA
jgi:hypothetical protein